MKFNMHNMSIKQAVFSYAKKKALRFHTPGHKGRRMSALNKICGNALKYDITELSGTDNLSDPKGVIDEAQKRAAKAFGAAHSFFSLNGSTLGNLAMITYGAKGGGKIIVDRNCHISVFSAIAITGAVPVYVGGGTDKYGINLVVSPGQIEIALLENPDARAVFVTSPNVFGITCDLKEISSLCQGAGALLLVDEAHGAHFAFGKMLPKTAISMGADICVQSMHKTLPSPTQTALIHVTDKICHEKMRDIINLYQTTSPSYLLMAAMDGARSWMQAEGELHLKLAADAVMKYAPKNLLHMPSKDILRLVFLCDGFRGEKLLNERNIVPEMVGPCYIVCIVTAADTPKIIKKLLKAAALLPPINSTLPKVPHLTLEITPKEAFMASGESVSIKKAVGRVVKRAIYCYPPGIPVVAPGEKFTSEMADYIICMKEKGVSFTGINKGYITVIK